jgi:predicted phage terminase large subunit-like protein
VVEAGNTCLPHAEQRRGGKTTSNEECVQFPNGAHDDQVDAMTQALLRWHMVQAQQVILYRLDPDQLGSI